MIVHRRSLPDLAAYAPPVLPQRVHTRQAVRPAHLPRGCGCPACCCQPPRALVEVEVQQDLPRHMLTRTDGKSCNAGTCATAAASCGSGGRCAVAPARQGPIAAHLAQVEDHCSGRMGVCGAAEGHQGAQAPGPWRAHATRGPALQITAARGDHGMFRDMIAATDPPARAHCPAEHAAPSFHREIGLHRAALASIAAVDVLQARLNLRCSRSRPVVAPRRARLRSACLPAQNGSSE